MILYSIYLMHQHIAGSVNKYFKVAFLLMVFVLANTIVQAQNISPESKPISLGTLELSGWIPYWREASGTAEAISHISLLKEVSPFGYTVKADGTLVDVMGINDEPWVSLIAAAKKNKTKVIPTVMWGDPVAIDTVLRSNKLRTAHIKQIVAVVKKNNFDGIDIDYEAKYAETSKYFSLFLKELYAAMGNKFVSCSIEARTPLDSRFAKIPKDIEYANDYVAINKYCDRVRIMAYDQGTIDLKLNASSTEPYIPVADDAWVTKVINLASKTISKKKIELGVATYGYAYDVGQYNNSYIYNRLTSFNQNYATTIAGLFGITPNRNRAGELSFSYTPTSTPIFVPITNTKPMTATSTPSLDTSLFTQVPVTNSNGTTASSTTTVPGVRLLWWSDAEAIKNKITLAKKLGIRGVVLFKLDGGMDPKFWDGVRK